MDLSIRIGRRTRTSVSFIILLSLSLFSDTLYGQHAEDNEQAEIGLGEGVSIEQILQSQRWVLQQVQEINGDSLIDHSATSISACQSDDYLQFSGDNTYFKYEGERFCTEEKIEIVGKGSYEMLSDSMFETRYQEGRRIEKRVMGISDKDMIVKYEGQGGSFFVERYKSQQAIQDSESLATQEISPEEEEISNKPAADDYRAQLEDLFWNSMVQTDRYTLMTLDELEAGEMPKIYEDLAPYQKKVVLIPFLDKDTAPEAGSLDELNENLPLTLLQGADIDYLVGGSLENIQSDLKKNGAVVSVLYTLRIWDATSGATLYTEQLASKHNGAIKKAAGHFLVNTGKVITTVAGATSSDVSAKETRETLNDLEEMRPEPIYRGNPGDSLSYETDLLIHEAILKAISKAKNEMKKAIHRNMRLNFRMHSVKEYHKKKGWPTVVKIKAGSIANISQGDVFELYLDQGDKSSIEILGEIVVQKVEDPHHALCKILKSNEALGKIIVEQADKLSIRTTGRKNLIAGSLSGLKGKK